MLIPISTVCIWTGLGDENKYEVGDAGGTAEPLNYTLNVYFSNDGGVTYPDIQNDTYYGIGIIADFMLYNTW